MAAFVDHPAILFLVLFVLFIAAVALGCLSCAVYLHCMKTNATISALSRAPRSRCWLY